MKVEWKRLFVTLALTYTFGFTTGYLVFGDWAVAAKEAWRGSVVWTLIIYSVMGVFRRELNRPKYDAKRPEPRKGPPVDRT